MVLEIAQPCTVHARRKAVDACGKKSIGPCYDLVKLCKAMNINVQDYLTYLFFNSNTIEDEDEQGWTNLLPDKIDKVAMSATVANYRQKLFEAKIDINRTEPYRLRGKRV